MSGILMRGGVVFVLAAAGAVEFARAELVVNGDFETGGIFPWNAPATIPNQQYFTVTTSATSHGGTHHLVMSSTSLLYVSQVLPTVAGTDYELSFWLRRPTNGGGFFTVRYEGQQVFGQTFSLPALVWTQFTVPLHSNITGSFLQFGQMDFPGEWHIDDISVVQVPAPSAAAVLGIGAVVAMRRRRQ